MSERGEYAREYELYLRDLANTRQALVELGDHRNVHFVAGLYRYVMRQSSEEFGLTPRQLAAYQRILKRYGTLITDARKRSQLLQRRELFMAHLERLELVAAEANDAWLLKFLPGVRTRLTEKGYLTEGQRKALRYNFDYYKIATYRRWIGES